MNEKRESSTLVAVVVDRQLNELLPEFLMDDDDEDVAVAAPSVDALRRSH